MGIFVFAIGVIIAVLMVGRFEKWKCEDRVEGPVCRWRTLIF